MAKLLNTIKACVDKTPIVDQPSPFHLPALEQPYNFEETICFFVQCAFIVSYLLTFAIFDLNFRAIIVDSKVKFSSCRYFVRYSFCLSVSNFLLMYGYRVRQSIFTFGMKWLSVHFY